MPKILINELKQEISSFNPHLGQYKDFLIARGPGVLAAHRGLRSEVAGALGVFAEHPELTLLGGYSARAITSGGTLADEAFAQLAEEFLGAVRANPDVDAIYFCLHGACAAETIHDCEGYLLAETRKIVGDRIPLVTSLDLHGILTDTIIENSSAIVLYHTYPHVDFFETGERAARLLLRMLNKEVTPVTIRVPIPALVRGNELKTATGRWGECVRAAIAFENSPAGLSGGMFIGNPFTDVPDLLSNVLLVANGEANATAAETEAVRIAEMFWAMRHHLHQPVTPLKESIARFAAARGRVVLVDAADATSSGASGDSNAILGELLAQKVQRTVLLPIVDAPAVAEAMAVGIGVTLTVPLGGTLDAGRFTPLAFTGTVRHLSDGRFRSESNGEIWDGGLTAVLEGGNITVVITSQAVNLFDRSLFLAHGLDPAFFDGTVVKSPHCQPHMFDEGAEMILNIDAPGSTSANLPYLGHTRCARPIFPLEPETEFTPQPRRFYGAKDK
jgi:microcystin degradation protein MlrC